MNQVPARLLTFLGNRLYKATDIEGYKLDKEDAEDISECIDIICEQRGITIQVEITLGLMLFCWLGLPTIEYLKLNKDKLDEILTRGKGKPKEPEKNVSDTVPPPAGPPPPAPAPAPAPPQPVYVYPPQAVPIQAQAAPPPPVQQVPMLMMAADVAPQQVAAPPPAPPVQGARVVDGGFRPIAMEG
ncbi:hypothetical protein ES703_110430 [subsurface metagenome]